MGMHCASCEVLIEENLKEAEGVEKVMVSLVKTEVIVEGTFTEAPEELAKKFSERIKEHGYTLSAEKQKKSKNWHEFLYAIPFAVAFIGVFYFLQKSGILNFSFSSKVGYGTAVFIGIIASLSTCLAIVGGLILSMSANYAKKGDTWKPQTLFHAGRLVSFFVLGGVIGAIGSTFKLGLTGNLVLGIVVAVIMLILGINLLDVVHTTKRLQLAMPKSFSNAVHKLSRTSHWITPLLVGAATFFLPCGFTQSMQIYTLGTGSFVTGAFTMLAFALGTFPVLAALSFGALTISHKPWKGIFFKSAGLVVIALALFNALNALAAAGIISPIINL
jgi:sulfite exporter TauE/SafE/copper chaperone CopZ